MIKFFKVFFLILFFFSSNSKANTPEFDLWLNDFKLLAKKEGVSESTIKKTLDNSRFLPKVIEYDRYQPEFYEDTLTYIGKRATKSKAKKGIFLYKKKEEIIKKIEKEFSVSKELLLALMGIETNFGKYLGKMDIISSLATLSFDKRRSEFFSKELLTLLKLVDKKIIDHKILYGSWAGAFGNFQFMPTTIKQHAIDYDGNSIIELKNIEDSFASAANYINKLGWNNNEPCFYKIELKKGIPKKYLNTSAKKIKNKRKFKFFKKYIKNSELNNLDEDFLVAIITPDKDIVSVSSDLEPAYLVFNNYELILKWNRSLRFGLAVCTLKNKIKNEI
jgi:membrane-bound lytic murein transglycosylase B